MHQPAPSASTTSAVPADSAISAISPASPSSSKPDHARGVTATWTYTLGSIVFVVVVLAVVVVLMSLRGFADSRSPLDAALILLMIVAAGTQIRYCWFLQRGLGGGLPRTAWTVALLAPALVTWVLGLFSPTIGSVAASPLWMAICILACLFSRRRRWMLFAGGIATIVVHAALVTFVSGAPAASLDREANWLLIVYGALFPVMLVSGLWWWQIVVELDRHRRTAAELAVARERLRFAADLHDIQGHHLQVIALKSELAERMLDLDLEAARANIHETRLIAKQALEETRSLVHGYREIALDDEIENAREVLSAAGAECELDLAGMSAVTDAGAEARRALALAVREATTNIVRHSTASKAAIWLGLDGDRCVLTITNNGLAPGGAEPGRVPGSGLAGLKARVAAIGGGIETRIDAGNDQFELRAWVPTRPSGASA